MFAPRIETTAVPSKGSRVSQSELRWLFQLSTAGIPPMNGHRPAQKSIPIIDLTGDDSDVDKQGNLLTSQQNHVAHQRDPSNDDDHPSHQHTRHISSSSVSHFDSLPIRQREVLNRRPVSPEQSPSSQQIPHKPVSQDAQTISHPPPTNKRKKSESADEDEQVETWSVKRLRVRRVVPAVKIGAGGGTTVVDNPNSEDDPMDSVECVDDYDDDESEGEEYEVEQVIAEKSGPRIHEFLLAWVGYEELSWIPASNCFCADLIAAFRAVPRVHIIAESLTAREQEENRVRRSAARPRAARPPKVKRPRVQGVGLFRNPKTGRFERMGVIGDQLKSNWEGIQSDGESNAHFMSADVDVTRDAPSNTADILSTTSSPRNCDAPRNGASRLPSKGPSKPNAQRENQTGEVIWVRETPFENTPISEGPGHVGNHRQRPRQTAKITRMRDTPRVDDEQSPFMLPENAVRLTSIKSEGTPTSSTTSAKAPGRPSMASKTTQTSPARSMQALITSDVRSQAGTDTVQTLASQTVRVEPHESNTPRKRSRPAALIDVEITENEGSLVITKKRVHDQLSNALLKAPSNPSTRDAPGAKMRERSVSSQTQAFSAEIDRARLARRDGGAVRSELRGHVDPYYAKGLVALAKEYSGHPLEQNHPYGNHPETKYGFSLSNESLVPSIET